MKDGLRALRFRRGEVRFRHARGDPQSRYQLVTWKWGSAVLPKKDKTIIFPAFGGGLHCRFATACGKTGIVNSCQVRPEPYLIPIPTCEIRLARSGVVAVYAVYNVKPDKFTDAGRLH